MGRRCKLEAQIREIKTALGLNFLLCVCVYTKWSWLQSGRHHVKEAIITAVLCYSRHKKNNLQSYLQQHVLQAFVFKSLLSSNKHCDGDFIITAQDI